MKMMIVEDSEVVRGVLRNLLSQVSGVAFALGLLSTLYPAWSAARLLPAESLRND